MDLKIGRLADAFAFKKSNMPRRTAHRLYAAGLLAVLGCGISSNAVSQELVGLDHFAINVHDLQVSANWYNEVLGFRILHKWNTTWMVGRDNIKVGLFLRPDATRLKDIDSQLIIQHVAFLVDGDKFSAALDNIRKKGVTIVEGPEDTGIAYSFFFQDPDGHLLEITTYHPTGTVPLVSGKISEKP